MNIDPLAIFFEIVLAFHGTRKLCAENERPCIKIWFERKRMAFVNFGLDWGREPGPNGRMWGKAIVRGSKPCDFSHQIGIYILQKNGDFVYVGKSGTGKQAGIGGRLVNHAQDKDWDAFSWFGIRPVRPSGSLVRRPNVKIEAGQLINDIEAVLIFALKLKLNKKPGSYKHIVEYVQVEGPSNE